MAQQVDVNIHGAIDRNINVNVNDAASMQRAEALLAREERIQASRQSRIGSHPEAVYPQGPGGATMMTSGMTGISPTAKADMAAQNQLLADEAARRREVYQAAMLQNQAAQQNVKSYQMLGNGLLAVNMSLLGVSFTYQNISNMMNLNRTQELQELQMKEKKSKADKERIKSLQKEQLETQKWNTILTGSISLMQVGLSIAQMYTSIKMQMANAEAMDTTQKVINTKAQMMNNSVTTAGVPPAIGLQAAKAGWLAPIVIALITAATIGGITAFMAWKGRGAASGADINPTPGGVPLLVGEGGQRELVSPVPMLERIVTERTREVIKERGVGGGNIYINAVDSQSFSEGRWKAESINALRGVT